MSNYWKKKLDELNKENAKKSSSSSSSSSGNYWQKKMDELEESERKKKNNDIAPVKTTTKKKEEKDDGLDFFQKGAFEDGYQFGDVTKAILGTGADVGVGIVKGASKLAGGVLDAGAYGVAGLADVVGADSFADDLRAVAKENVVDNLFKDTDEKLNKYSVLGRTSDSISEGLGQVGGIILTGGLGAAAGLGTVGATVLTTGTMGASSLGSGMSEAYQSGATDEEAATYGLIKGVVDAGSELIFGGLGKAVKAVGLSKGLSSLDDVFAQKLASKITNHTAKNFVEYGVKASAEGVEEVLAGIGTAVGKKLTYMSEEELTELVKDENLMEQFVVGAVTSGVAQSGLVPGMKAGSLKESIETGRDFVSGLSQNEQKVIDKVYEDRIAEAEKDGKKLTKQDKSKLYDEVINEMERGYISTDTIEEVLGGDTFKSYKDTIDSEDALKAELDELRQMKKGDMNDIQQDRLAELKAMNLEDTTKRDGLKKQLGEEVFGLVQSDRLAESYNERTRRGQAFEADLTKYNEQQKAVIQKAVESGILNNTNRTHEFVDMIAKISADKGVLFDFTNNEKLKGTSFAVDGKTVNGFVTKDGVTLNIDSAKSLNSVVGHEITHVLEGTDLYDVLQKTIVDYAKSKGDYQGRYDALTELYKDIKDADVNAELTADLVGDYLFTDSDFIKNLSVNNRNVFQKIYDEIKYLCKVATAGSKEARELEKVKRAFDKAYKADSKGVDGTKHSVPDSDGNPIDSARISDNEIDTKYSLSHNPEIAKGQSDYVLNKKSYITAEELEKAQEVTNAMVDVMMKYSSILPEDKIGKVLTKNGSYDRSVENTTICVRTLAYNEFVDKVQEEIGRPLTQMESFLVSQKLYDIAVEPQCLYCYVSLDRKAFNDMLLRYMQDRDTVIAKYNNSDKSPAAIDALYEEFLHGRKPTKEMKSRFDAWISYVDNGTQLLSLADIATEDRQSVIKANGGNLATQLADARKYAQSASWSKIQKSYVAYRDEILKLGDRVVKNLNEHYGLRWYSFSDYSAAFIVENMQQITDASIRGLKGLAYTKDTDFAEIFAPSGMNINVSVFVNQDKDGNFFIDEKQSANFEKALELRERYPNVGIVATVTNDDALRWAGSQEWSDVIIPFHIVRTGTDVAEYYKWLNYTAESADTIKDKDIWNSYLDSLNLKSDNARKKVSKNIYPNEHKNDKATYLNLCESRGLSPRFVRFAGEDWYMKLVNETRLSADASSPLKPVYNEDAAKQSFQKFVNKGGYEGGWYNEGVDVDAEARSVADDVLAGKKANEVNYGRQDGFNPESLIANRKTNRTHGRYSLGDGNDRRAFGNYNVYGEDIALETAPVSETTAETKMPVSETKVEPMFPDDLAPVSESLNWREIAKSVHEPEYAEEDEVFTDSETGEEKVRKVTVRTDDYYDYNRDIQEAVLDGALREVIRDAESGLTPEELMQKSNAAIQEYYQVQANKPYGESYTEAESLMMRALYNQYSLYGSVAENPSYVNELKRDIENPVPAPTDADAPPPRNRGRLFDIPEEKTMTADERRAAKLKAVQTELAENTTLRMDSLTGYNQEIARLQAEYDAKKNKNTKVANDILRRIERVKRLRDSVDADYAKRISDLQTREKLVKEGKPTTRQEYHRGIVENIKGELKAKGFDLDEVLKKAKNLSTFATVDNTPQRVMEKALGYKEGQALADVTVNQVAQNETEGIKWLNSYTDKKNGLLAQISKKYEIKPGSKESAAAQMYAEGFYVGENNDIIAYGDAELAKDFPDAKVQANIKGLAKDERIRQIYDETLAMINESRTRNAYPEIQKLDNYFLHFRAMDDTFSRLGLPFNPNDIRAKDLPTDLNGVTTDLKPGQPYFASAMHRTGKRTSFDLLGGLERYLSSAKNQIYHIDDIQTLRALRNYIADTYGQANGLEGLDALSEEEAQERIEKVYNSHLSTFAKFLNEEANILAGKTALIDRGLEGIIGRRGITFLNELNKQVGSNMVGYNVSSSLTNFIPVVQTIAKGNKGAFVKAFAQTVASKVSRRSDSFLENSPVVIRRKGADRFYRTAWQKMADPGYALMSAVDSVSTELIARTKFNELVGNGMDEQKAHYETDKWVSRLMGDRSLGQMPQMYNSKMLGLITKFQLEVRNQLDSQFYDTIQEAKVSNEHIQNEQARNAKTAAKVASTFFQLAVAQHIFGAAFESIAGYNPAFDIIEVLMTAFGFDDEEDSEDTALDNLEQGLMALAEDLPYASVVLDGGRIPIASALPIEELFTGQDEWGNEKSRWETLKEVAPYYFMPGGYGQLKKTTQGLGMFSDDHPIAGSYTDSGNLRFPVEDTIGNRIHAGIFGQWANENARDYFDNERNALKEKQIQEFIDVEMPIRDYWEYREGLNKQDSLEDKFDYIAGLDLPVAKKNILINNIVDRKEAVDMTGYEDFSSYEEFDFATKNPDKYEFLQDNGVSYSEYTADKDKREWYNSAWNHYKDSPGKVAVSKAVAGDFMEYYRYKDKMGDIEGVDEDGDGKTDSGSVKANVINYVNGLNLDYGQRLILFMSKYNKSSADKKEYVNDIVDYLNNRDDISPEEMKTILNELGFKVDSRGYVTW